MQRWIRPALAKRNIFSNFKRRQATRQKSTKPISLGPQTPGLSSSAPWPQFRFYTTEATTAVVTIANPPPAENQQSSLPLPQPELSSDIIGFCDDELTPRRVADELGKYIIGQEDAKRAVAIALRNRIRRHKLKPDLSQEIIPKNILMIGPTGVGKTEVARRMAKLVNAPFIKVEATKFTEVGFRGKDVDSIVQDLVETAILLMRDIEIKKKKKEKLKREFMKRCWIYSLEKTARAIKTLVTTLRNY